MSQWYLDNFTITTNKNYIDRNMVYKFLSEDSYWAKGIPRETVEKSIDLSMVCYGIYDGDINSEHYEQVGFARVVSDLATLAYVCDVFVLSQYRGKGLSKWLMEVMTSHLDSQGVRVMMLATKDAHSLYEKIGFKSVENPEIFMYRANEKKS
ncbi:GNAT family N-acetyltransferase [Bacillus salitolerans]|uniref:GNAT family N-acetyltransferase n=1 Tax=Bacillus salitolerans TaxID=1437434 RepID=A0ABW4LU64_9BACI